MTVAAQLELNQLGGNSRPLEDWLTTFPLACVVLDPFTHESSWILDTSRRILQGFREADCRPCWLLTCTAEEAGIFLGPYAEDVLTFVDPTRAVAQGLGIATTPAFLLVRQDGQITAKAEGWEPNAWREVAEAIAEMAHWSQPAIPAQGDPAAFAGAPIGTPR